MLIEQLESNFLIDLNWICPLAMIWRSHLLDKMTDINVRKYNFTLFLTEKTTRLKQNNILYEIGSSKLSENLVTLNFVHRKDFSKKKLKQTKVTQD